MPTSLWRVELFGGIRATREDRAVTHFRTRKTAELLGFLAYNRGRSFPRDVLIELLWPECDVESGRHSLSMALSVLRQRLRPSADPNESVFAVNRHTVGIKAEHVTTDTWDFESALVSAANTVDPHARLQILQAAVDLYGGEFLSGFYGEWILPEQQRLEEAYYSAVQQLLRGLEQDGEPRKAIAHALRAVSFNRLREEAHRDVMRLYISSGQPDLALRHYDTLKRLLREETDSEPSAATCALVDSIHSAAVPAVVSTSRLPEVLPPVRSHRLEPVGGAVPIGSRYYILRPADSEFATAIQRRDSTVLIKGPRQVGKSSLLARGLQQAREGGARVVFTHFQVFNDTHFDSPDTLLMEIARSICEQLDLDVRPEDIWEAHSGANPNFRRFMRRVVLATLSRDSPSLVWAIDEADRLLVCPFGSQVFGLFRSWHDERALEPEGPWRSLSLAIAYSTEPYLFIQDVNQSPFNIGTRILMEDFSLADVEELHRKYGSPLGHGSSPAELRDLVGGQPYLVQRALYELASRGGGMADLRKRAATDDGVFGDHLRRIRGLLSRDEGLCHAVVRLLKRGAVPSMETFHRLRSAGILSGDSVAEARIRCRLYADYLSGYLDELPAACDYSVTAM